MHISAQRTAALEILAKTGIRRSNYTPPLVRLFWRLGLNVPPPHFAPFGRTAVVLGVFFAAWCGPIMWLVERSQTGISFGFVAVVALGAGALFGLGMASYYVHGRKKHKLPSWRDLESKP